MHKPVLLVDAGNSLLKWALMNGSPESWQVQDLESAPFVNEGTADHALEQWLSGQPVDEVWLCSVLGEAFERRVALWCAKHARALRVIQANRHPLLHTNYIQPERLGKDRWSAMLAVVAQLQESPGAKAALVVSFGTATTVDAVVHASTQGDPAPTPWVHLGGYIIPGVQTMLNSLHQNTAQLPQAALALQRWPDNTLSAIGSGVAQTQIAMVQRCLGELQANHQGPVSLFLSGGLAPAMAELAFPEAQVLSSAVLRGLCVAFSTGAAA